MGAGLGWWWASCCDTILTGKGVTVGGLVTADTGWWGCGVWLGGGGDTGHTWVGAVGDTGLCGEGATGGCLCVASIRANC